MWSFFCTQSLSCFAALPQFLPMLLEQAVFCDHLKSNIKVNVFGNTITDLYYDCSIHMNANISKGQRF